MSDFLFSLFWFLLFFGGAIYLAYNRVNLLSSTVAMGAILLAYLFYVAGVFTVISMAANYGQRLGFTDNDLVLAFLITNFAGFPATFAFGIIGQKFGPKTGLYIALGVYIVTSSLAVFMTNITQFFAMAIIVGCVQGAAQGLSRSLYARLIPQDAPGEFFGFYNLVTKFAHAVGPGLVGIAALMSDNPRIILLALLPLFIIGALVLGAVRLAGSNRA